MSENVVEKFVGIDVSKATLDVCIMPQGQTLHVAHDEAGVEEIVACLKEAGPTLVVLEATGGLEVYLASELAAAHLPVAVINPRQARDFAKASGQLAKTDTVDAAVLAEFGRAIRPQVRPLKDEDTRALDGMVTRRRQLIDMRVQETLRLGTVASKALKKSLTSHIVWLDKRIAEVDVELRRRLRESEVWREKDDLLCSITGVGKTTSVTMLAKCPELGTLNRHQVAALAGLAPLANDSGKRRGKRSIWGGRAEIRAVLYMATTSAISWNAVIKAFAARLKAAGKPHKVVMAACMRKLLTIMNAMLKNKSPWNPKMA